MSETPKTIIFCGTPDFAVPSLQALANDTAFKIILVITQPDQPVGRKRTITPPPVKVAAEKLGLPVEQPENINSATLPNCDYLVVVAYGQILKQEVIDHPNISSVNLHGSLLPIWRGASPMQPAILHGHTETGVSVQRVVLKVDAGDVLAQELIHLGDRETFATLHDKLATLGAPLLCKTLEQEPEGRRQDPQQSSHCKKLTRKDGEVEQQNMTATEIDRMVRALNPWPGVTCEINSTKVKLLESALIPSKNAYELPCKDDTTLYIEKLHPPGKKSMTGAEWKRGKH
ncbi:MAG: methionyl-tRNA formyltransferase [Candidatus Peribacteraceae bacterium]|nr:methionyl-tRNA formyltransferase [Candidatus Peribacteraceae bacterium]